MLAGLSTGIYSSVEEVVAAFVEYDRTFEPNLKNKRPWEA
jgi:hypothetical protein